MTEGVGGHGVVGILANGKGPTLMLRTDLDARVFRRTNNGVTSIRPWKLDPANPADPLAGEPTVAASRDVPATRASESSPAASSHFTSR